MDAQTDLKGDEVENLLDFQSKYFGLQSEMDSSLRLVMSWLILFTVIIFDFHGRRMEGIFTVELQKSDEKISRLSDEIITMQVGLLFLETKT